MTTQSETAPELRKFEVIIRENSAYARHAVVIEAASPEAACEKALELIFSVDAPQPTVEPLESDTPFITDVREGNDEVEFPEEFGELGQLYPETLKLVQAARGVVELIDTFDDRCSEARNTDTGEVWEVLNSIRDSLLKLLPEDEDDGADIYVPGPELMDAITEGLEQMAQKAAAE